MTRRFAISLTVAAVAAACGGSAQGPTAPATPAAPGAGAPATPPAGPKQDLATAEAVIEASLVAQGGRDRIGKVKAMRQTGTFAVAQMGMKGTITTVLAPPRNAVITIELPGIGKLRQGVSGDVAWDVNPITGARVIAGAERTQLLRESTFNGDLVWKELYPKAELAGVVERAGKPAYKVVLTAPDGDTQTRYYAKDTLLQVGLQMVGRSQMGDVPIDVEVSDWREVGGIQLPHRMKRKEGPQTIEIAFDKIELDPQLDPATFELPPEIATLVPPP